MKIETKELPQQEVDSLIKNLSGEPLQNFRKAFHAERENFDPKLTWALPRNERIYYLALLQNTPYLLIGIHPHPLPAMPHIINISSIARIALEPRGKAADCFRVILEERLIPFCKNEGKRLMSARITTGRGLKVFEAICMEPPVHVINVSIIETSPDWSCTIEVDY